MWAIIKAELKYYRLTLAITFILILNFFLTSLLLDSGDVFGFMVYTIVLMMVAMIVIGTQEDREKRDRMTTLLPVSIKQVAFGRILFILLFQGSLFALWLIVYLARHLFEDAGAIWSVFSMTAYILSLFLFFIIYHDLKFFENITYRIIFFITLFLLLIFFYIPQLNIGLVTAIQTSSPNMIGILVKILYSEVGRTFWSNLIMAGLIYTSYDIFIERKSYLA
jgi:hypothetical protein